MRRIRELKEAIDYLKRYRRELPLRIAAIDFSMRARNSSLQSIAEAKKAFLQGKSLEYWERYCDEKIRDYRHELTEQRFIVAKSIGALVMVACLLSVLFIFTQQRGLTGFVTLDEISPNADWHEIGKSAWRGWEPFGSYNPVAGYRNFVGKDSQGKYYFVYLGDDINLTYILDKNPSGSPLQLFKGIVASTKYKGEDYRFRLNKEGLNLYLNGQERVPWDPGTVTRTIESETFNGKNVTVVYRFTSGQDSVLVTMTYEIKGKTLIAHASSNQGKVASVIMGQTGGEGQAEQVMPQMPYTDKAQWAIRKGSLFFLIYNDYSYSGASKLQYGVPSKISETLSTLNIYLNYLRNSAGQRKPLQERLYFVVSPDIIEVYPKIPNSPSPYRNYMADRIVLDLWSRNGSYNNYFLYSQRLKGYGLDNLHVIIDGWGKGPWPHFVPPSLGEQSFKDMVRNHNNLGYNVSVYTIWQDIYPSSSYYGDEYCMHYTNGTIMKGWCSPTECTCPMKYEKRLEVAQGQIPTINSYGTVGEFSDAIGVGLPDTYLDMQSGTAIDAQYRNSIPYMNDLISYIRTASKGPVMTEGFRPMFWAGSVDTFEASTNCCTNNQQDPVIVDFNLRQIHPLSVAYGGYYRRFFDANNDYRYKGITESDMDKYMATHIAFGHIGSIDSTAPWLHNIPDRVVVRLYYMYKELQKQYALYDATEIRYHKSGQWKTLSELLIEGYNFRNAQVMVKYSSGLILFVNRHSQETLTVRHEGIDYVLPPNGWLAYNDGFFEFSGLIAGTRVDIAETPAYTFIDTRGQHKSIILHDSYNYTGKTLGNGSLVPVQVNQTLNGQRTVISTSVPLILKRQSQQSCEWQCSSWDSCDDGWMNRSCVCGCATCQGNSTTITECQAPQISNFSVKALDSDTARVTWQTDIPSNSSVLYGPVPSGVYSTVVVPGMNTSHRIDVPIMPGLEYTFVAVSTANSRSSQSQTLGYIAPQRSILLPTGYSAYVNGTSNASRILSAKETVEIWEGNTKFASVVHDFSSSILNLSGLSTDFKPNGISINGWIGNKTVWLSSNTSRLCIDDSIKAGYPSYFCNETGESRIDCPGSAGQYSCSIDSGAYKISGIVHSGISAYECDDRWICGNWSVCESGRQQRTCECYCASCPGKPIINASCGVPAVINDVVIFFNSPVSADISWQTDTLSDGKISLGVEQGVYMESHEDANLTTEHRMTLQLLPNTTYYYKVSSRTSEGLLTETEELVFTTPSIQVIPGSFGLEIDGISDMDRVFKGEKRVTVRKDGIDVARLHVDFDKDMLDLSLAQADIGPEYIVLEGFPEGKTAMLAYKANRSALCVVDAENANPSISPSCNASAETLIECPGTAGGYSCIIDNGYYSVAGLNHSALVIFNCSWQCGSCDERTGRIECRCPCSSCPGEDPSADCVSSYYVIEEDNNIPSNRGSSGKSSYTPHPAPEENMDESHKKNKLDSLHEESIYETQPISEPESQELNVTGRPVKNPVESNYLIERLPAEDMPVQIATTTMMSQYSRKEVGVIIAVAIIAFLNVSIWIWHWKARRKRQQEQKKV